jgi:hypothetical protein
LKQRSEYGIGNLACRPAWRAEAQVVRLALLYALLDQQNEIGIDHLTAGLAMWDYCDQSARYIFGTKIGDAIADTILATLRTASPERKTKTELWHALPSHNIAGDKVDAAMTSSSPKTSSKPGRKHFRTPQNDLDCSEIIPIILVIPIFPREAKNA